MPSAGARALGGPARDLFSATNGLAAVSSAQPTSAAGVPSAPALPFTYLGKKLEDGEWEVYLSHADQTVVARQGGVLASAYRVDAIAPPHLQFTYLPLGLTQDLSIGDKP